MLKSRSAIYRTGSPASSRGSHRTTPSPPASFTYRSSNSSGTGGSHRSSVRNSPYHSPWDSAPHSQGGSVRGSARNSPHHSPRNSLHGSPSPSPELLNHALVSKLESVASRASGRNNNNTDKSPRTSPKSVRRGLLSKSNSDPGSPAVIPEGLTEVGRVPSPAVVQTSTSPVARKLHETPPPTTPPHTSQLSPSFSQSPSRSVDFESGRVLSQLPYEYSSFLDVPPDALGKGFLLVLWTKIFAKPSYLLYCKNIDFCQCSKGHHIIIIINMRQKFLQQEWVMKLAKFFSWRKYLTILYVGYMCLCVVR